MSKIKKIYLLLWSQFFSSPRRYKLCSHANIYFIILTSSTFMKFPPLTEIKFSWLLCRPVKPSLCQFPGISSAPSVFSLSCILHVLTSKSREHFCRITERFINIQIIALTYLSKHWTWAKFEYLWLRIRANMNSTFFGRGNFITFQLALKGSPSSVNLCCWI